jgi:D-glycero-D-manno-heptose 1,7-bisphosphate phosphatase
MAMAMKAVLVDMGGVILEMDNSRGFPFERLDFRGREALLHLIRHRGGHASLDDLERLVFEPWHLGYERRRETGKEELWDTHLSRLRKKAKIRVRNLTLLEAWFRPYGEQLVPIAGAVKALESLRSSGLQLSLVSNVPLPGKLYCGVLRRHAILDCFQSLHFSYDAGSRKPSPAMLRSALGELGVRPTEAVMVGDRRPNDVAAGRAAGTATVWVRADDGGGPAADFVVDALAEVPGLLGS